MESKTKLAIKRFFYPGFNLGTRIRKRIRHSFLKEPNIRTLDLGCGNGYYTGMAVAAGGTALGVSFDADQIARCNEMKPYLPIPSESIEFRVMNAAAIQNMEERFDQIVFLEVTEHIDNDEEVMRNIARLLKPGGVAHISTPDIRWGHWVGFLDRHATGGHVRLGYSAERLEKVVRSAGLDVAHQLKFGGLGNFLAPLQNRMSAAIGGGLMAEGIAFLTVYPFFLLLNLIPVPDSMKIIHYITARKRVTESAPA